MERFHGPDDGRKRSRHSHGAARACTGRPPGRSRLPRRQTSPSCQRRRSLRVPAAGRPGLTTARLLPFAANGASIMDTCSPNMAKHSSPVLEAWRNPHRRSCCFHRRMRRMFGQSPTGWRLMWNKTVVIMSAYGHDCSRQNMVRSGHLLCCDGPLEGGFCAVIARISERTSRPRRGFPAPLGMNARVEHDLLREGRRTPGWQAAGMSPTSHAPGVTPPCLAVARDAGGPALQEDWARRAGAADSLQRGRARNSS